MNGPWNFNKYYNSGVINSFLVQSKKKPELLYTGFDLTMLHFFSLTYYLCRYSQENNRKTWNIDFIIFCQNLTFFCIPNFNATFFLVFIWRVVFLARNYWSSLDHDLIASICEKAILIWQEIWIQVVVILLQLYLAVLRIS